MAKKRATAKRKPATRKPAKSRPKKPIKDTRETLAVLAIAARLRGETLSRTQIRDVTWYEKLQRRQIVAEYVRAIPKGEYCDLTGRQQKLVDDAARNYDLPIGGSTIDLADALTAMHDLIADNAHRIRGDNDPNDRVELEMQKLCEQIRVLRNTGTKGEVEIERLRRESIRVAEIMPALIEVAASLRQKLEPIAKLSPDNRKLINDALENLAIEIEDGRLSLQ